MTKKISKRAAASQAKAAGHKSFEFECNTHGHTAHYSSSSGCIACALVKGAEKTERRRIDPEYRAARNAVDRASAAKRLENADYRAAHNEYVNTLRNTNPTYRGNQREKVAANDWLKVTGGNLPASYASERGALQRFYATLPEGAHADHLTPKKAKDAAGVHVASGLHAKRNLVAIPAALNRVKRSYFDPENYRDQRPANAFPGGQWDPELTEAEWSKVELLVRRYSADRDTTVRAIQAQVVRQQALALAA